MTLTYFVYGHSIPPLVLCFPVALYIVVFHSLSSLYRSMKRGTISTVVLSKFVNYSARVYTSPPKSVYPNVRIATLF